MVGMQVTFGNCDQQTPHGGPPFHYWKQGHGFGHSKGPGNGNCLHPAAAVQLRFTPKGDRGLAYSPFWRGKWELGPAPRFGIGDRPSLNPSRDCPIGPDNYGDVSPLVKHVKRNATREGIKLKPRFPSVEEKARDYSWPASGPGPAKYNTSGSNPSRNSAYSFGIRPQISGELKEKASKPGPDYKVRIPCGKNSPISHGTLYDISMAGKTRQFVPGEASPGPARYNVLGKMDEAGLWSKIANVKPPPAGYWRQDLRAAAGGTPLQEAAATGEEGEQGLTRCESSPV